MMRAPSGWAVAVRNPAGEIVASAHQAPRLSSRSAWARMPLTRGVMVLGESLVLGYRALAWSAHKSTEEPESEAEPVSKRQISLSMAVALVFFVGVFIVLPLLAVRLTGLGADTWAFQAVEAVVRIALFVGYIWAIGRMEDIRRVFAYHGAEHMTIHAYESDQPLDLEHIGSHPPQHPRCGTSFLLIVMLVAIAVFGLVGDLPWYWLIVSRVALLPVIAGISYEILKLGALRPEGWLGRTLAAPGLWLQRLTTRSPEEPMMEVAIVALLFALTPEEVAEVKARGAVADGALRAFGH